MNIVDFMRSPDLTPGSFEGDSWKAWEAVLSGAFALSMDADLLATFKKLAGGRELPESRVRELYVIAGRRSAKTNTSAGVAVYLATIAAEMEGLTERLSPGERGVISVLAVDRSQAKVMLAYINGLVEASPVLNQLVERRNAESIDFTNNVSIEVATNSYKAVRGRTLLAALMDECAFYRDNETSAANDREVYRALVPGLATTGGMLIGISSPYAKRGLLYEKYRKHYGQNHDVLVIQGATTDFNPTLDPRVIEEAEQDDPEAALSEWYGQFRDDISGFIQRQVIENAMRSDPPELPYDRRHKYFAFADPAGGGKDEFTLSIGHTEDETVVVDLVRGRHGVPASIVSEYSDLLTTYGINKVWLDKYAGSWPTDEFARHGIEGVPAEQARTGLYLDTLAALNSDRVQLPPDTKMLNQFIGLERRTSRNGRETVDHPPGLHDDRCNAAAGLISHLSAKRTTRKLAEWL